MDRTKRAILIAAGTLCVTIGVVGIVVPLLPTTPFLLLAAYLYSRSSERYLRWLLSNRWFGKYLKSYRDGLGIPVRVKIATLVTLWCTLGITGLTVVSSLWVRLALLAIGLAVSIHLLWIKSSAVDERWPDVRRKRRKAGDQGGK